MGESSKSRKRETVKADTKENIESRRKTNKKERKKICIFTGLSLAVSNVFTRGHIYNACQHGYFFRFLESFPFSSLSASPQKCKTFEAKIQTIIFGGRKGNRKMLILSSRNSSSFRSHGDWACLMHACFSTSLHIWKERNNFGCPLSMDTSKYMAIWAKWKTSTSLMESVAKSGNMHNLHE